MNQFPHVLEAVAKGDRSQWVIGDALRKDINDLEGATRLVDCSEMLRERGFQYTVGSLKNLHTIALAFPASERRSDVSWSAHRAAGTPENLARVITALRKLGRKATPENVDFVMQEWRDKERAEREKAERDAKAEADAARRRERDAKDEPAKKKAKQEREEAEERARETKRPPKTKTHVSEPPSTTELEVMAAISGIDKDLRKIQRTMQTHLKTIDKHIDRIDADMAEQIREGGTRVLELAKQITDRFKKNRRFDVIKGGAA